MTTESLHSTPLSLAAVPENSPIAAQVTESAPALQASSNVLGSDLQQTPRRSDSGASFLSQATSIGLCIELVPEYISFRLRSVSCIGLHNKTQVRLKLQNISQSTKPSKSLGDHTHEAFDFQTTVHNMTFDIIKIDVFDIRKGLSQNVKIGRAYLPLRELQKKVGNAYDNDGDDNTEPEQSVLSTRFDAAAFCQKHDDVFELDLPLYKHGSYSKFGSVNHHHGRRENKEEGGDFVVSKGSEHGKDTSAVDHRRRPVREESFAQVVMNGIEVGMVTVQATLHFKDQTKNPLFAHLGRGIGRHGSLGKGASAAGTSSHGSMRKQGPVVMPRSQSNRSIDSSMSSDSSTLGDSNLAINGNMSDHGVTLSSSVEQETGTRANKSVPIPTITQRSPQTGDQQPSSRILQMPSSPPNLSRHYGASSPPLSPSFSHTPGTTSFPWPTDNKPQQNGVSSWEESDMSYGEGNIDGGDAENDDDTQSTKNDSDHVKGENLSQADRDREEELMANIMANGNKAQKDIYLNKSNDGQHPKGKKAKFNFFSEQTRSAFKDIQLMYSSFFGHGWNLSRSEFWKGFHIVEQFYERHPTPTTNHAFDNIEILEHARHFVRLAIASYGSLPWVYFGYSFKVAPLNFVRFNSDRKNVQDYFKLKKEDMIVWHFDKRTALVPSYYIVRDPKYNALCIIIRGTFSITDAMTDLVCEYYPYKGGLVHKGIMDNARFVLERSGKDIEAALKKFNLKTVYCIGHSLGAGSASLLCSLLQDHFADHVTMATPDCPAQKLEVKAYLFAPPPICTPNLAADWERTQIAFINENDIVCRMSYGNALDLKELIKIGALESQNPAYDGLNPKEKLDRILKVMEKAQERLRAVDDVPRLVTAGTVTYIHKVYEDTPVVRNKNKGRQSKFGLPETWSDESSDKGAQGPVTGRSRAMSTSSNVTTTTQSSHSNPLTRSLTAITAALSLKTSVSKRHDTTPELGVPQSPRLPKVTPYQPNQPPVRLESSISLALSDLNERHLQDQVAPSAPVVDSPLESPTLTKSLGQPIQYTGPSNARELATAGILGKSHNDNTEESDSRDGELPDKRDLGTPNGGGTYGEKELDHDDEDETVDVDEEEEDEYDEDRHKVFTTKKPHKNGSKKKEIRIEFSDKSAFMAIPLRTNWLWHHFPQQYDSRIERALAWAKAHKEKEDKKRELREQRQLKKSQSQQQQK